ncbi:MAG: A24 family peptidase [Lachnospiraceae bacterium]|nr:A24 family peptidase [Lachnospiraceae bacterium]
MVVNLYMMLGAICDWRFYRIPNVLCFCTAVTGIFFSYLQVGMEGVKWSMIGMIEPVILLYLLFYCRVLGAGDIKLLAAAGTFFGKHTWKVIFLSFLFNGIGALVKMCRCESLMQRYYYLKGYLRDCRLEGRLLTNYHGEPEDKIHFSIGIFLASMIWFLTAYLAGNVSLLSGIPYKR